MTHAPAIDLGTDGPAARARPSRVIDVGAVYRGSVALGDLIQARKYSDSTLYDRMHARGQLSDKQHKAAEKLHKLYGALPRTTSRYGEQAGGEDEPESRWQYRRALASLPAAQAARIEALILGEQHPGWRLGEAKAGLDELARVWGLGDDRLDAIST